VEISRTVDGDLLIHPITENRGQRLLALLDDFDDDFIAALEDGQKDIIPIQGREPL
jgi:antitoxin VapB